MRDEKKQANAKFSAAAGNGKKTAVIINHGNAPNLNWNRDDRQLNLNRNDAGSVNSDDGASASAMVMKRVT